MGCQRGAGCNCLLSLSLSLARSLALSLSLLVISSPSFLSPLSAHLFHLTGTHSWEISCYFSQSLPICTTWHHISLLVKLIVLQVSTASDVLDGMHVANSKEHVGRGWGAAGGSEQLLAEELGTLRKQKEHFLRQVSICAPISMIVFYMHFRQLRGAHSSENDV